MASVEDLWDTVLYILAAGNISQHTKALLGDKPVNLVDSPSSAKERWKNHSDRPQIRTVWPTIICIVEWRVKCHWIRRTVYLRVTPSRNTCLTVLAVTPMKNNKKLKGFSDLIFFIYAITDFKFKLDLLSDKYFQASRFRHFWGRQVRRELLTRRALGTRLGQVLSNCGASGGSTCVVGGALEPGNWTFVLTGNKVSIRNPIHKILMILEHTGNVHYLKQRKARRIQRQIFRVILPSVLRFPIRECQ